MGSPAPVSDDYDFELVLVSYYSRDRLEEQLDRLPFDLPIVVVDNASGADRVDELLATRPHARYVDGGGKGFAKASNLGVATSLYEHVVFGNPDSYPTAEIMRELVRAVRSDPSLATCAAMSVGADGRPEFGAGGWEPTIPRMIIHATGLHLRFPRWGVWARPRAGEDLNLGWIAGTCMAARVSTFLQLGGWDERYFVYNEDMQLGRRVRQAGLRQQLRTDLAVAHSGDSGAGSASMLRLRGTAMTQYLWNNHGPLRAGAMWAILATGTVLRILHARRIGDRAREREFRIYLDGLRHRGHART